MIPPEEIPFTTTPKLAKKAVKVKIEFADDSGTKYSFNIEGTSKENIGKLIDFAQSVSAKQPSPGSTSRADGYKFCPRLYFNSGPVSL